jgi:hypothetical protein
MPLDDSLLRPLPKPVHDTLLLLVQHARQEEALSFQYIDTSNIGSGPVHTVLAKSGGLEIASDILVSLECLGMLQRIGNENERTAYIYLTLQAFEWADYQRKSPFGRWWARSASRQLNIVTMITVVLAVLQILQIFNLL